MGKGSKIRPRRVSEADYFDKWDLLYVPSKVPAEFQQSDRTLCPKCARTEDFDECNFNNCRGFEEWTST